MSAPVLALEINDLGVAAARGDRPGPVPLDGSDAGSPGFVLERGNDAVCGREAEAAWRLDPPRVRNSFWDRLGTEAFPQVFAGCSSNAELAFAHLRHILAQVNRERMPVVLAVPPFHTRPQAGLLLKALRELGVPRRAFVPTPLAVADPADGAPVIVVDLFLHRATATLLAAGGAVVASASVPDCGALELLHAWSGVAVREFLRQVRFDPLHHAASEQRLHDQLRGHLAGGTPEIVIEHAGRRMQVRLPEDLLAEAAQPRLRELAGAVARSAPALARRPAW
ncbi:MAG: hypothetical protein U1F87_07930 [Kiritimatiellia bacterium]